MDEQKTAYRRTVLKTIGAFGASTAVLSGTVGADTGSLEAELAEVRSATAEYNDPANAEADGYHSEEHAVCGMGFHWPNFDLIGIVDRTKPQVLVYGEDDDGDLILGAVEYLVPKVGPYETKPPDLFEHDDGEEDWGSFGPSLWALHVWAHTHNPEGVFNPTNSRRQFCPK